MLPHKAHNNIRKLLPGGQIVSAGMIDDSRLARMLVDERKTARLVDDGVEGADKVQRRRGDLGRVEVVVVRAGRAEAAVDDAEAEGRVCGCEGCGPGGGVRGLEEGGEEGGEGAALGEADAAVEGALVIHTE